ncbi:tRNA-intron endonuclease [Halogranum amylolyticum]|uniref:tRNA-splicing endonuclease n=1 Tax=Halogranum amylolyticum TaxID=660520 RepID=A0A1H8R7A0_9EURY|nr:tRNA-intron lyase [Halogranum amylolyticum]SEO62207.1 tRNA-intron endonuclease [Halogranum amylolyticum]
MDGHLRGDVVRVGGDARQRFHDSRGYGRPAGGNEIDLSRVEAAHLLFRGDLDAIDGMEFEEFFVASTGARERFALRFLVYVDLRGRGFYLSPTRKGWPGARDDDGDLPLSAYDFVVHPRGTGPGEDAVEHRVRVVGERQSVPASELLAENVVLAVVDEESELTYLEATRPTLDGATDYTPPNSLSGVLLEDRVVVWDAPESLYEYGFYGQPLTGRDADIEGAIQLSLVEAASLAADGVLSLDGAEGADAHAAVVDCGRAVEGERFDRRLAVYSTLRERQIVPKTGYKFGADFRTYAEVESVSNLSHSEHLIRVLPSEHVFAPRDLALDVRLAGGVRKRMVFALTGANEGIDWLSVARLTP